jgi:hypothetical protein
MHAVSTPSESAQHANKVPTGVYAGATAQLNNNNAEDEFRWISDYIECADDSEAGNVLFTGGCCSQNAKLR